MYLTSNHHFRNLSAFSKRNSENNAKKNQLYRFGLKQSSSKTTLEICPTDRSQSQANETINNLGLSQQQMQSPHLSQFHIKTFIRFRPQKLQQDSLNTLNKKVAVIDKKKILCEDNFFTYDHVFEHPTKQQQIYNSVCKQMVEHFVRGFNSTVFAYGQTGSGKTYTMFGDLNDKAKKGIIPSAIKDIYSSIKDMGKEDNNRFTNEVIVSCSMLQIYKEQMIDLLSNEKTDLKIKENQFFNVSNLTIKQVPNEQEMYEVLKIGNESKKMRQTCMNEASSRSHVIFTIYLEVRKEHQKRLSKFNLVDLAGSQKVSKSKVEGEGLEQAKKINLSLSCLGNTINALLKKNDHIPYRESKLTRLLYEPLGGNSLTRLIVTCSSEDTEIEETLSSLKFASRAKNLKTNPLINTLRKSQKSVSRIAYENLKTNLSKAEYKINKIKGFLTELKNDKSSQYQTKNEKQHISDKQNRSIMSNTESMKENQKMDSELQMFKIFAQKVQNIITNSNKEFTNKLELPPLRENIFVSTMSNPFLMISEEENNSLIKSPIIQQKIVLKKSSGKKKKQLNQRKQQNENQNDDYWQIIKVQEKEIDFLKKKIQHLEKTKDKTNSPKSPKSQQTNSKEYISIDSIFNSSEKPSMRTNNIIQLENSRSREKENPANTIDDIGRKCKKLNIKVSNKVLPVRQIFLTSPTHTSVLAKPLKFSNEKASSSNKSKGRSTQIQSLNSPKEFILTEHQQDHPNRYLEPLLREINKKLDRKNEYEKFEKNILLRQLELLFDEKVKSLPESELKNQVHLREEQNKKITLSETNELLVSQIRYIEQLESALNKCVNQKIANLSKQPQASVPKKIKLNPKHLR